MLALNPADFEDPPYAANVFDAVVRRTLAFGVSRLTTSRLAGKMG